jgi:4-hydroxy-tetrahydrodipicolinate reductase
MVKVIANGAAGRMGRMIVAGVCRDPEMELVGATEFPAHPDVGRDAGEVAGVGTIGVRISPDTDLPELFKKADVAIEFTAPEATIKHLEEAVQANKPMVIATTGYTPEQRQKLEELASQIPCVVAPNMSVGVNVLLRVVSEVAEILGDDYDVEIVEIHHNRKKDSPSGTALRLAEVIAQALERDLDEVAVYGRKGFVGERERREIGIHAVRGGDVVGDHTVIFAGSGERIEIIHRAHSREAFARGALRAAKWVVNASKGMHDIQEVLFG